MIKTISIMLMLCLSASCWSAKKIITFPKPEMAENYKWLTQNLRCQKCANQSLADSESGLANDLRQKVYTLVLSGKNRKDIISFLSTRFGDRVTYDPPFKRETWFLWLAPGFLLLITLIIMKRAIHNKRPVPTSNETVLSDDDQQRLAHLLESATQEKPSNFTNESNRNSRS